MTREPRDAWGNKRKLNQFYVPKENGKTGYYDFAGFMPRPDEPDYVVRKQPDWMVKELARKKSVPVEPELSVGEIVELMFKELGLPKFQKGPVYEFKYKNKVRLTGRKIPIVPVDDFIFAHTNNPEYRTIKL